MDFNKIKKQIFKVFLISFLTTIFIMMINDVKGIWLSLSSFNKFFLPIIMLLIFFNYIFRIIKWNYYLKASNIKISLKDTVIIFLSAVPMTITPGKIGEILKPYLLKVKYKYPISKTTPIIIIERITDAIGMIFLAGLGSLAFNYGIGILIIALIITTIFLSAIRSKKLYFKLVNIISKISLFKKHITSLTNFYESTCDLLKIKILIIGILLGVMAWLIEGLIIFCICRGFGINISIMYSIFIMSISSIIGVISMIPGGMIASEGSIFYLLFKVGAANNVAAVIVVLSRIATMWLGVIIGAIVLIKIEKLYFKNIVNNTKVN